MAENDYTNLAEIGRNSANTILESGQKEDMPASTGSTLVHLPAVEFDWITYMIWISVTFTIYIVTRVMTDHWDTIKAYERKNVYEHFNNSWTILLLSTFAFIVTNQVQTMKMSWGLTNEPGFINYTTYALGLGLGACLSGVIIYRVLNNTVFKFEGVKSTDLVEAFRQNTGGAIFFLLLGLLILIGVVYQFYSGFTNIGGGGAKWILFFIMLCLWIFTVVLGSQVDELKKGGSQDQSKYKLHIHHWQIGYALMFLFLFPSKTTALICGLGLGMFVEGISTWGSDSVTEG
jgi:hypothetical protein